MFLKSYLKFAVCSILISVLLSACAERKIQVSENESRKLKTNRVSSVEKDSAEPNIAAAPDGGVYLVWAEHSAGKKADIFLKKFDREGNPTGEQVRVNPEPEQATAWRGDPPSIKIGADKSVYVGWTANVETGGKKGTNLYLSVSRNDGKSFGAPVKVNDDSAPASHGMHSLAVDKSNHVYLAWLDERNVRTPEKAEIFDRFQPQPTPEFEIVKIHDSHHKPENSKTENSKTEAPKTETEPNSEIFYAVSKDGGKTFSANKKVAGEICPCCKTSIIVAPDEKVYVSWRQVLAGDYRHIAVAASENHGETFSAPVIVSDDQWQINACPVSGASLAIGAQNQLEILWFTGGKAGEPGLYRSESSDGGKTFAPRSLVFENVSVGGVTLQADEAQNFNAVWESGGKIFSRTIQTGQTAQSEIKEIGDGELPSAVISGQKLFAGFIKKEGAKRSIWLTVSEN
jgi:hypothetical protein